MAYYLYGAAVQGIQDFIFQTNKLREIVGASELVEEICTSKFARLLGKQGRYKDLKTQLKEDPNAIVHAAGNIKYLFTEETKSICEKIVKYFPKEITAFAPGITVSQGVECYENNEDFPIAVKRLESKLRIQRNKAMRFPMLGLMGIERSRQTGLPVCLINKEKHLDASTFAKLYFQKEDKTITKRTTKKLCVKAFGKEDVADNEIPYDVSDITNKNEWIAVIHVDGNGLGQIVQKIGIEKEQFKSFSEKLDEATIEAAVNAYKQINETILSKESLNIIPLRPIVLGGDDHTLICRGDLAVPYVECFIREFEKQTKVRLSKTLKEKNVFKDGKDFLTACAGIAFIKASFPFYYGYGLAESLCSRAKADAKKCIDENELPASCIMFYKIQDSFVDDYKDIIERELKPQENISFEFGPYYLEEKDNRWTIEKLNESIKDLNTIDGKTLRSGIRNWISMLYSNIEQAEQFLNRLKDVSSKNSNIDEITKVTIREKDMVVYPVYDMLVLHTIQNQETKKEE